MMTQTTLYPSGPLPMLVVALLTCIAASSELRAQDVKRCEALNHFLIETMGMEAESSLDTVDDWRTQKILPGCRGTAAGSALREVPGEENEVFYFSLLAAGWTRTPAPHDRPQEAAIRLRLDGTDCFFTPYHGIRLGTEVEMRVNTAFKTRPGEDRYNFLAQCVEALPAAP